MSSIDKLSVVSQLLYDERIIEQRQEIERLRLQLFWKDHDMKRLTELMAIANGNHTKCACDVCGLKGRIKHVEPESAVRGEKCLFGPWFNAQLVECGLVAVGSTRFDQHPAINHRSLHRGSCVEVDCHFTFCPADEDVWLGFFFGERLWKATTVDDPELRKLSELRSALLYIDSDDE
jgi:hypothetical protein